MIKMVHDGKGNYACGCCGNSWEAKKIYQWWPVRFKLVKKWSWGTHGVEAGHLFVMQKVFVRVVRLGPIRIALGEKNFKSPIVYQGWGWLPRHMA